jgi:hypothetical protein
MLFVALGMISELKPSFVVVRRQGLEISTWLGMPYAGECDDMKGNNMKKQILNDRILAFVIMRNVV